MITKYSDLSANLQRHFQFSLVEEPMDLEGTLPFSESAKENLNPTYKFQLQKKYYIVCIACKIKMQEKVLLSVTS